MRKGKKLLCYLKYKNNMLFLFVFLLTVFDVFSKIERYELVDLNGKKVYFPKENKSYIEELFSSDEEDKLLYLAEFYIEIHEEELALYFFNSYNGHNTKFKGELSRKLGIEFLTKEFKKEEYREEPQYSNYNDINSLNEVEAYLSYFKKGGVQEKNIYEKLYRYKFEGKTKEFEELCESLSQEAVEAKNEERLFVIKILRGDYEAAKELAYAKPELFMGLIGYMEFNKVEPSMVRKYVDEFKGKYDGLFGKEMLLIELDFTEKKDDKIKLLETYLNSSFDKDIFEIYYKIAKSQESLKKYLVQLVFEKTNEKYITYLIELDKTYETEENLEKLFDKSYYFKYLEKNKGEVPDKYQRTYIEYLHNQKNYEKLLAYKEVLDLPVLKELAENGYKEAVIDIIRKKYPLELEYADMNDIRYFYFNENLKFDEDFIKELLREKQLNPVETYYLSRYYLSLGEKEKALELEYALKGNYNLKFIEK